MSPGDILGPELDLRDGGVLDVVTLLGASRLETRRGSRLPPPVLVDVQG
jgi:hypothetical protein